ncbi:hypothetical protein [Bifidobacterium lemurum]|uniref:hypothetical protein n=1 Tax=Bifidobacterium lemurum TaxID=1603886 RepID=UPI001356365E|nr:hypothetical protein [Bifidobacterium lemurum]
MIPMRRRHAFGLCSGKEKPGGWKASGPEREEEEKGFSYQKPVGVSGLLQLISVNSAILPDMMAFHGIFLRFSTHPPDNGRFGLVSVRM